MIKTISCVKYSSSHVFFFKIYNIRIKTIRKFNIKDCSGYFFEEMINILDIEPEYFMINDFKGCKDDSTIFNVCCCEEYGVPHVVFNDIECIFRKSGVFSCLIFCGSKKIVDKLKEEILSFEDDKIFIMGSDFMRFRFKTDDNLVYNQRINIPVCVRLLSCIVKKGDVYYLQFKLQDRFYEN